MQVDSGAASTGAIPLGVCAHAIELRITAQHISGAIHPVVRDPNLRWTTPASPPPILSGSIGHLLQRTSRPQLAGASFLTCFGKIMLPMRTRVNGAWFTWGLVH